jgi:hypothetical protein
MYGEQNSSGAVDANVISVRNWILTLVLLAVPLVNIAALFYWAFGASAYPSKRTYARANLVLFAALLLLYAVLATSGVGVGNPWLSGAAPTFLADQTGF